MSRISILLYLLFISTISLQAEKKNYTVPVSKLYYAKVFLENSEELSSPGWIGVYDKNTDRELIRVNSDDLYVDYDEKGIPSINIAELPYGSQSVIIYDDFNFDGVKDFALREGNTSCYAGPSYQVFLADGKGGFEYNEGFTDLAQSYCGFFAVDKEKKRIHTMTKSGCCWHWFYTFDVVANTPRMREEVEEIMSNSAPFLFKRTTNTWDNNNRITVVKEDILYLEETQILFSFKLKDKARTVIIAQEGGNLYYLFVKLNAQGDNVAEFCYPSYYPITYRVDKEKAEETLSFSNESASYQVYNSANKVGVRVTTKGKVYNMPGDIRTRKTKYFFDKLEGLKFNNLIFDADYRLDSITN